MRLQFGRLGGTRKGDLQLVQTSADKTRLRLSKQLFESAEYDAITAADSKIRDWVKARALPADVGMIGAPLVPLAVLPVIEERLTKYMAERESLVADFLRVYQEERTRAQAELSDQFDPRDYPPEAEAATAFAFRWWYTALEVPEGLPPELAERERAALQERLADAEVQIRGALRESLAGLCAHLVDRLTPAEGGKKKRFFDSAIGNLVEFLELFGSRNVTGDADLATLANKARAIVENVSPDAIRRDAPMRDTVRAAMSEVAAAAGALAADMPRRKFNWDA